MKLLGWMHSKLRQHRKEQTMNFTGHRLYTNLTPAPNKCDTRSIGNPSSCYSEGTLIDKQLFHAEPTYSFAQPRKCPKPLNKIKESERGEIPEEKSHHELFRGLLAIGTLGSVSVNTEPPTPTFYSSFQNTTDKQINITENNKLVNNELEKFLEAEAKEVTDESSARGSQVSIIDFSNKQLDDADLKDGGAYSASRPLQKYLFGNSIQLPTTAVRPKKEKMPSEELFCMNDGSCKNSTKKYDRVDKAHKQSFATHCMKNILKKLHSTATSCTTASSTSDDKATKSEATKSKLPKVLKVKFFHRKIHPEEVIAEKHLATAKKAEMTKVSDNSGLPYAEDGEKRKFPEMATGTKVTHSERINGQGTTAYRERWIKTDDDYLVLEL